MLSWIFIVLAYWYNSLLVDTSFHSDLLSWFRANQSSLTRWSHIRVEYPNHFTTDVVRKYTEMKHKTDDQNYLCSTCWLVVWFDQQLVQTKDYEIGICSCSVIHAAVRSKNEDWLARNQDNLSRVACLFVDYYPFLWIPVIMVWGNNIFSWIHKCFGSHLKKKTILQKVSRTVYVVTCKLRHT